LYWPDVIKGLVDRYGFMVTPAKIEDLNLQTGVRFGTGKLVHDLGATTIDSLTVFEQGLVAESKSRVEELDAFLDDLIEWMNADLDIDFQQSPSSGQMYTSVVVVQLGVDPVPWFNQFSELLSRLNESVRTYLPDFDCPYVPSSLIFHYDESLRPTGLRPGYFSIERRRHVPFAEGVYYSTAPLRTDDHLRLLTAIENIQFG
jgi:hypothetical protein